jgi:NAD-dependent dihydropyrimidine dehydrogenase PreA subunit
MPNLANKDICTGCMACMNACAKGALLFQKDDEGFLQPEVDATKCVECGMCEYSCPEIQHSFHQNEVEPDVYAGWNKTDRQVSSSGGAFSSVARHVLSIGGVVYGATLDENLQCKHIEVDTVDGLNKLRGSKYLQSNIGLVYKAAKKHLIADQYVLFTGTPCQVSGLLTYLGKEYKKLITIDLICHGVPSNALFFSYVKKLEKRLGFPENEAVTNYEFRRRDGWGESPSISSNMNNSTRIFGIDGLYMSAFDRASIFRRSCYQCHYGNVKRVGDFTIGDFWGLGHQGVPFKYDMTKGVSLLIVNTDKGRNIMSKLDDDNLYVKRTLKEAVARNHNLRAVSKRPENREDVIKAFLHPYMTLDEIEKRHHLMDKSLKKRLSTLSSKIGLYDLLKKIHNTIG